MNDRMPESARRWRLAGIWTVLIYSTLPVVPEVWFFFGKFSWTPSVLKVTFSAIAVVSAVVLVKKKYIRSKISFFLLSLLAGAYLWGITLLSIPVERMHFIEYGILAVLVYRALVLKFKRGAAYLGAFLITSLIGWGDEGIQYLLPNRYYQFKDVVLNIISAALGLALIYIIYRDGGRASMRNLPSQSS